MCGIAGISGNNVREKEFLVKAMTDSIAHRGPDGQDIFIRNNCILGHRRLSIVDLSTGDQPMLSHDGKKAIIFNGEIYGYKKIRSSLNYPYKTTSDTEVILALYEEYGEDLFEHLPGMFSIALWNEEKQQLLCGRDRFGEKPFYYALTANGEFIFASEIKALLASGLIQPVLRRESVTHYLQHLYVHPMHTIYENIFTLPAAHYLIFSKGTVTIKRYWNFPQVDNSISLDEAAETFRDLFEQSVKNQLVADVPVGAFLSGGIDSSLVVAVASKFKHHLKTVSFGFGDQINELPFAKIIAEKYKTDHVEIQQPLPDLGNLLCKMQEIYDEPFADSSNIPTYLIAKETAKQLKVALTGDGGDELLGGYAFWYRHLINLENGNELARYKKMLLPFAARVANKFGKSQLSVLQQQQKLPAGKSVAEIHKDQNNYFTELQLRGLGISSQNNSKENYSFNYDNTVNDAMRMDIENYMPGDILVKTDRAAMASSLELRAPFLDKDLAEFCISLPYKLKLNYKEEKIVAKKAFADLIPPTIVKRKKQGFGAPVGTWLKSNSLKELKHEYLQNNNRTIYNLLDYKTTQQLVKEDDYKTWILLSLSVWMEKHNL